MTQLPLVTAPDGMPVRPLPLAPDAFLGAAIGYLAPGARYAVHLHYALDQLSFVVKGQVAVTMQSPGEAAPTTHLLAAGEAIANPPGTTLSFANPGDEPAEILLVCAPPFPGPSDYGQEVVLPSEHRPLTEDERGRMRVRREWALEHFRRVSQARL